MTETSFTLPKAYAAATDYAITQGAEDIKSLPGCYEADVDGTWWIAINGHSGPIECSRGGEVLPFHVYVEFNGWPAGVLGPAGGILAGSEAANEETFIAALEEAS